MLASVGDRLLKTLQIKHLAFFLAEEGRGWSGVPPQEGHGRQPAPGGHQPEPAGFELPRFGYAAANTCFSSAPAS